MTTSQFDLVIRNGVIYDGTGSSPTQADIAVKDACIVEIGRVGGRGAAEIDATDKIVTPGFIDIHTHYDGQALWEDSIVPSAWHGVTTAVMGNCGVGFAPCKPEHRDLLIELMEGVEDIPGSVMHEGLPWNWETFEEYLDALGRVPRDIDLCALLPHAPLRVYVMGDRALRLEPARPGDIAVMRDMVAQAIRAGAFGVSTSRTTGHRTLAGGYMPTLLAREREMVGLAMGIADAGTGVFEFALETADPEILGELGMMRRVLEKAGCHGLYSLTQTGREGGKDQDSWRKLMKYSDEARRDGVNLRPVVAPRGIGLVLGLESSQHPFAGTATYQRLSDLPLPVLVQRLHDPAVRQSILSDDPYEFSYSPLIPDLSYSAMYRMGQPPNYAPDVNDSLEAIAKREGRRPEEVAYDVLLENDGLSFIYVPFSNFASGDLRVCQEMLENQNTVMGLGDGGAHVGFILDASFQTWMLTYWVKEKGALSLEEAVRRMTSDTADEMGLSDRGRITRGLRADINVVDMDRLELGLPYAAYDLPNGGRRLLQKTAGLEATIVAGEITYREGVTTGARPGRLVRNSR